VLLDASALIAALYGEPGADTVAEHLGDASVVTINLEEVAGRLLRDGMDMATAAAVAADPLSDLCCRRRARGRLRSSTRSVACRCGKRPRRTCRAHAHVRGRQSGDRAQPRAAGRRARATPSRSVRSDAGGASAARVTDDHHHRPDAGALRGADSGERRDPRGVACHVHVSSLRRHAGGGRCDG
jgi:hypothetical protein